MDDTKTWIKRRNADVRAKRLASASPSRPVGVSGLNHSAAVKAAADHGTSFGIPNPLEVTMAWRTRRARWSD